MTELSNLCGLAQVRAVKKSCHAALVFSQEHVVGLEGLTELLSRRCLGAAKQTTTGPSRQASPLTVAELQVLHNVLADPDGDVWDRNMAGSFLGCVYTRSRWSDFQHSNEMTIDPSPLFPEFVELSISEYKTKYGNAWRGGCFQQWLQPWGSQWRIGFQTGWRRGTCCRPH